MSEFTKKEIENMQDMMTRMLAMPVTLAYIRLRVDEVAGTNNEPFLRLFRLVSK